MNSIQKLQRAIQRSLPGIRTNLRRPRRSDGTWWLDAQNDDHVVTVEWTLKRGFGVSSSALGAGYGEGPDETFPHRTTTERRVIQLLRAKQHTFAPGHVLLRELRALTGMTQQQLADKLGVQQAAVSRLERRQDISLGSLRRYVSALGGDLEIKVRTAAGAAVRLLERSNGEESTTTASLVGPRVNLLVIRVANLDKSRAFYSRLGLDLEVEKHGRGPIHYSCTITGTVVELYPSSPTHPAGGLRFGLRLPDPVRVIAGLRKAGLLADEPKLMKRDPGPSAYVIRDPDHNTIELEL